MSIFRFLKKISRSEEEIISYLEKHYPGQTTKIQPSDKLTRFMTRSTNIGYFSMVEIRIISTFHTKKWTEDQPVYGGHPRSYLGTKLVKRRKIGKDNDLVVDATVSRDRITQNKRGGIYFRLDAKESWEELQKLDIDMSNYRFENRFAIQTSVNSLIKDLIEEEPVFKEKLFSNKDLEVFIIQWDDEKGLFFRVRMEEPKIADTLAILHTGIDILVKKEYFKINQLEKSSGKPLKKETTAMKINSSLDTSVELQKNMKTEPAFSKNYEKTHLSSIKTFEHRRAFFCQLDNERHPLTESGYECERCSRTICDQCYQTIVDVGVAQCPYCRGKLGKFQ